LKTEAVLNSMKLIILTSVQ